MNLMMRKLFLLFAVGLLVSFSWISCGPAATDESTSEQVAQENTSTTDASSPEGTNSEGTSGSEPVQDDATGNDAGPSEPVADETPQEAGPTDEATGGINAPPKQWTWVDVPESKCGYGSQTGFAVNPGEAGAKKLFIYMQGGGACWDNKGPFNCFASPQQRTAVNLEGYDKAKFEQDPTKSAALFLRTPLNPLSDAHFAYIPYCSGDVFNGNGEIKSQDGNQTMTFNGHKNMQAFIKLMVATFPNVEEVIVSGSSAGGFGAMLNWWLVQEKFGSNVKVHLLNDSGQPFNPIAVLLQQQVTNWKTIAPADCNDCATGGIEAYFAYYKKGLLTQGNKMGLLSYDKDKVIRGFYGLQDPTGEDFKTALSKVYDEMDKINNAHYYGLEGEEHVLLGGAATLKNSSDVLLLDWIKAMLAGSADWKSYRK